MSAEPPIVIADEHQKRNVTEYFIIAPKVRTLNLVPDARDQNRHYDLFGYAIHCLSVSLFSFKHTYVCGRCIIQGGLCYCVKYLFVPNKLTL